MSLVSHTNLSSCQIWSKRHILCRRMGAARRPFPAPVQVLTWILSQPWDLGGHDEHYYADEDGHCPIGHHATGGAGRAGLVAQGCSGMRVEEVVERSPSQPLLASVPSPTLQCYLLFCTWVPAPFPPPSARGSPAVLPPPPMLTSPPCRWKKPGCPSQGRSLAPG